MTTAPMFLTSDELEELTGYKKPSLQKRWMTARGWRFEENAAGHPKILRALVEKQMGGSASATVPKKQKPNLGAIL